MKKKVLRGKIEEIEKRIEELEKHLPYVKFDWPRDYTGVELTTDPETGLIDWSKVK
jgi:hypothetical protein